MADKRKDSKGRILRNNERQRTDGRYEYRYTDSFGKKHSVYSSRLVETDRTTFGKAVEPPLRVLEEQIQKDLQDGIKSFEADRKTLDELFDDFIMVKSGMKDSTRDTYRSIYHANISSEIGSMPISSIKVSTLNALFVKKAKNVQYESHLKLIYAVLNSVFSFAVDDDLIRVNPVTKIQIPKSDSVLENNERSALDKSQQEALLAAAEAKPMKSPHKELLYFLLYTGCRISEAGALQWEDIDMEHNLIHIRHGLTRNRGSKNGDIKSYVSGTKSKSGIRDIPLLPNLKEVLKTIPKNELQIGHFSNFVFTSSTGLPVEDTNFNHCLKALIRWSNRRSSVQIPEITAHSLRHTFCTRLCETSSNIKAISQIMGHADVRVTLEIYADTTEKDKTEIMSSLMESLQSDTSL